MSSEKAPRLSVLVSPGQGSHVDEMEKLASRHAEVAEAYEMADEAVRDVYGSGLIDGQHISAWSRGEQAARISLDTRVAQPLIVASSIGINEVLQKNEPFTTAYGNSLGELAALVAAGAIEKEDGIRLAVIRGLVTHEASRRSEGRMLVIKNPSPDLLASLKTGARHGLEKAVHFSPDSITFSGMKEVVEHYYEIIAADYQKMKKGLSKEERRELQNAILLGISGGFHSWLMRSAASEFRQALKETPMTSPDVMLWFSNYSSQYEGNPRIIRRHLVKQLTNEVNLWKHVGKLVTLGHHRFVESGTAPQITNEYQWQQKRGRLPRELEFVFGMDEIGKAA